jgi:hypothetical protein
MTKLEKLFNQIAKDKLGIDTLETQSTDALDFHDVAVWAIKAALQEAYDAGRMDAKRSQVSA